MTIFLTSAATDAAVHRARTANKAPKPETAACVGPGPVLSIMRYPRAEMGEDGVGRVLALTPPSWMSEPDVGAKRNAYVNATDHALRARWLAPEYVRRCAPGSLAYGREFEPGLAGREAGRGAVRPWNGSWWVEVDDVPDGATLICACSRDAAGSGRCHRVIAADVLRVAGWRVVLDGREVT